MLGLSNFFGKFIKFEGIKIENVKNLTLLIKKYCNFDVSPNEITIQNGLARVTVSPLKRNEIFMHKNEIILELQTSNSEIKDII